jgi:hypothetical protein
MKTPWMALAAAVVLAACAPETAPTAAPPTSTAVPPTAGAAVPTAVAPVVIPESSVSARPAWQSLPLVDARTGNTFTLAAFAGRTVFVHPMAKW